jgi:RNA polymerase sigma-70 factor (ECF subfamily)
MGERVPEGPGRIPSTRWSVVRAAGQRPTEQSREAFGALCRQYRHPIYAFVRHSGFDAEEARDLTQAFFTDLLERRSDLERVDAARGRFRTWLKACLKHFLSNHRDHQRTLKAGGGVAMVSLDVDDDEQRYQLEPAHDLTPERLYDQRWQLSQLQRVLDALRLRYVERGRGPLFEALKETLMGGSDRPWAAVAADLKMKEGAVRVAAHRLREQFDQLRAKEIADTLDDPAEIDAERAELKRSFE